MKMVMYSVAATVASAPLTFVLAFISQLSPLAPAFVERLASVPSSVGYTTLCATAASAAILWARSFELGPLCFWTSWWATMGLALATTILTAPFHPCFAIAALAFSGPLLLYPLRLLAYPAVAPAEWFDVAWVSAAFASFVGFMAWLLWISLGFEGREKWTDWPRPVRELVSQGIISWKCAFAMWASPLAVGMELGLVALLCWVRQRYASVEQAAAESWARGSALVSAMKQVAGWLFALLLLIWINATMSATGEQEFNTVREDMSDEVVGLAFVTFLTMSLWVLDTLGPDEVATAVKRSKMVQETAKLLQNDYVRGFVFLIAALPMSCIAAVEALYCKSIGKEKASRPVMKWTLAWHWTSILVKASVLGLLYVSFVVCVAKLTTVLLAVVNETFSDWPVYTVSVVMFAITYLIFLFPASPGPPIYGVMGIVLCHSAARQGWSFSAGLAWATFVAFAMKLAFTATAQKYIGEPFSKSENIRRLVGVHTPYMRAIERILKEPRRVTLPKVALVVGGPDWPVAVLCGILRLQVWPILICISPVLVQSVFPSVFAGALLLEQSRGQQAQRTHGMAEVTLVVAGGLQLAMGVLAFYYVQEVLEKHYDELSKSRPEDARLEELEAKADAANRAFWRESGWEMLPTWLQVALISGFLAIEASVLLLVCHPSCFKKFSLMSSVEKDLDGSVFSIVQPVGWAAIALAVYDLLALFAFYVWSRRCVTGSAGALLEEQAAREGKAII